MKGSQILRSVLAIVFLGCGSPAVRGAAAESSWPQFRGPNASGVADHAAPPLDIGPTNGVRWKIEIPWSPSSPAVWDDHIFVTTFSSDEFRTLCFDSRDGHTVWSRGIKAGHLEMFHATEGSPAASSPATDGRRVVSYFGSFGLVCYGVDGAEIWRHPLHLAVSAGSYGTGASPIIVGDRVILSRDQAIEASVLAFDLATGAIVWETPRPDATGSFGTPIVWRNNGVDQIVIPGSVRLKGYDAVSGQERWTVDGLTGFAVTTPVVGDDLLFFAGWSPGQADAPWPSWETFLAQYDKNKDGEVTFDELDPASRDYMRGMDVNHDGKITKADWDLLVAHSAKAENLLVAVKPGGSGDITKTHIAWKAKRGLPYVPSPLFYRGRLYLVRDGGQISSFDSKTGEPFYLLERLDAPGGYYSSPVAADGRIYIASLQGKLTVIKAGGSTPEILHQADFGDRIFATPALVGDRLYLRTRNNLYAF